MRANTDSKKAQANIEFVGGFFLFITTVVYVIISITSSIPLYQAGIREGNMRLETWKASENFLRLSETGGYIDDTKLAAFRNCRGYNYNDIFSRRNYTMVKSLLNVSELSAIHILFEQFPISVLLPGAGAQRSGTVAIAGTTYSVEARNTTAVYDEVRIDGGAWTRANSEVSFGGSNYIVARIDPAGDFVIFKKSVIDCGPSPLATRMSGDISAAGEQIEIKRYTTYGGHIVRITFTYW